MRSNHSFSERPRPFRRRRFPAPRRRRRLWTRLLAALVAAIGLVGLPVGIVLWVTTGAEFRIREIAVTSGGRVPPDWARERLESIQGRQMLDVDLAEVEALVADHSWLRGVEIAKRLPSRLEVRILEREAQALLRTDSGLFFVDRTGEAIAHYDRRLGDGDYVVIEAAPENREIIRDALAVAETWSRSTGRWAHDLSEIVPAGEGGFRVIVAGLDVPLLVSRDRLRRGLLNLERMLPKMRDRLPATRLVDLRFSEQIVLRPALAPTTKG